MHKWLKLIAVTLLLSLTVNTVYAAASCACGMDAPQETSQMMDCHNDEATQPVPTASDCCPACIVLYSSLEVSVDAFAFSDQPVLLKAGELFTRNITPLYRPPISHLL